MLRRLVRCYGHMEDLNIEDATAAEWLEKAYWMMTRVPEPMYREPTQTILDRGLCGVSVQLCAADWYCDDSLVMLQ